MGGRREGKRERWEEKMEDKIRGKTWEGNEQRMGRRAINHKDVQKTKVLMCSNERWLIPVVPCIELHHYSRYVISPGTVLKLARLTGESRYETSCFGFQCPLR